MSICDPRDRDRTCTACESAEVGYHSKELCGRCYCLSLVSDERETEAFECAVIEGVDAGEVQRMVSEAHERRMQAFRATQARMLRLARAENDNVDLRPCKTPPPPVGDVSAVSVPAATLSLSRIWNPERGTVRPGRS